MMANPNTGGGDSDFGPIFLIAGILLTPFLLWLLLHRQMVWLWSYVKWMEFWCIAVFQGMVLHGSAKVAAENLTNWHPIMSWLVHFAPAHPGHVTKYQVFAINDQIGPYLRWPAAMLSVTLGVLLFKATKMRAKRYALYDVAVGLSGTFPWGLVWLWQESGALLKSRNPAFAYAQRPWDLCRDLASAPHGEPDKVEVDRDRLEIRLADQLGPLADEFAAWPVWMQALASAIAPQAMNANSKESLRRLRILAVIYYRVIPKKGKDYQPPELKKVPWPVAPDEIGFINGLTEKHAYRRTAFLALLARSRAVGMMPPAYFAWLRAVDRTLWYGCQSLGRPRAFAEGIGLTAHYQAEVGERRPLRDPEVDYAIEGMIFALREEDGTVRDEENPFAELAGTNG